MDASPPKLGRYVDLTLLGQGGMGAVYRARDPELDRPVAIKVVLDTHPDFVERFRREARAAARLAHPNVVAVYDVGEDAAGHPYFVMELVTGRPLDELAEARGRFSAAEVASVLAQAAAGLGAAHEAGIVHRDIKPSNLVLDAQGRIKIVDFGIARIERTPLLTTPSALLGTPTYMSPEQVSGKPVDARTDLYSLGVTAFHLIAGAPPFEATEPIALALKHLDEELPSLVERAPGVPPPLAALIVRLCAKDPERRPASARDVEAEALRIGATLGGPARPLEAVAAEAAAAPTLKATVPPTRAGRGIEPSAGPTAPSPSPAIESTDGARRGSRVGLIAVGAGAAVLAAGALVAVQLARPSRPIAVPQAPPAAADAAQVGRVATAAGDATPPSSGGPRQAAIVERAARPASGPVRVAVLKFKNLGGDKDLDVLAEGIGETVLSELAGSADAAAITILERSRIGDETAEIDFGQTKYVDPATAAALGRIAGAELAVQGAFQRAGTAIRITARFVRIDTGAILDTTVLTRPLRAAKDLLALQDAVAADLRAHLLAAARKARPAAPP